MTKEEFLEAHRHEIAGWIIDAMTADRQGGEAALWLRTRMKIIDVRLSKMYEQLRPTPPDAKPAQPPAKGPSEQPKPQPR